METLHCQQFLIYCLHLLIDHQLYTGGGRGWRFRTTRPDGANVGQHDLWGKCGTTRLVGKMWDNTTCGGNVGQHDLWGKIVG